MVGLYNDDARISLCFDLRAAMEKKTFFQKSQGLEDGPHFVWKFSSMFCAKSFPGMDSLLELWIFSACVSMSCICCCLTIYLRGSIESSSLEVGLQMMFARTVGPGAREQLSNVG